MKELIERIEGAEGPSRELDRDIALALALYPFTDDLGCYNDPAMVGSEGVIWTPPEFSASLDAAMTLVPEGWDSCLVGNVDDGVGYAELARNDGHMMAKDPDEWWVEAEAATPALALTACALKARGE